METLIRAGESRKFYQEIRTVKKGYQPTVQILQDNSENLITDTVQIKTMWRDYFYDLLNNPRPEALIRQEVEDNMEEVASPTFDEVKKAIMRLKNNKTPGIDDLPSELWKYSGRVVQLKLYELLKTIWKVERQPLEWNTGIISPIHKKGCKKKCNNYHFRKAYDSIDRAALYTILRNFHIPKKLIDMIIVATSKCTMRVRVGRELSDDFAVITGLKQGDALSPTLFNLVLEYVLRRVMTLEVGVQLNGRHKVIGYADDLALLGENREEIIKAAKVLEQEAKKVGLKINTDKTEYLHMKRYKNTRIACTNLHVGDTLYKGASKFKYLGCTITDTNSREEEIHIRVQNALRCSAALHKVLVSRLLSRKTKIRVYKTVIRPILMYGCEAWTLTLKEENQLLVTERKVLRKILGPTIKEDGSWRVRTNSEIEDLMAEPNIIGEIKSHRLRWLGHVERMEEDRGVKKAYLGRPVGRRPVGRPKYRWKDRVEADLTALQAHNWQDTAQDRGKWRALVSEAKTHFGSLSFVQGDHCNPIFFNTPFHIVI
ncbi:hypothetical protein K1T71_005831 [Dendrolimus kikuchii]|uniref:Uncharacterized protein n=1 Tax=Dendrolimus kikuchii TaxID=765133 RepID=A0ACC1D543_9NEOP|nr:hypothetical protein K1T71_005831 [Dendrolimus kikuchii]